MQYFCLKNSNRKIKLVLNAELFFQEFTLADCCNHSNLLVKNYLLVTTEFSWGKKQGILNVCEHFISRNAFLAFCLQMAAIIH